MILKTKEEILNWLENYDRNYKENIKTNDYFEKLKSEGYQYIINVKNRADISYKKLEIIPIQFYQISKHFDCYSHKLTSLKGYLAPILFTRKNHERK